MSCRCDAFPMETSRGLLQNRFSRESRLGPNEGARILAFCVGIGWGGLVFAACTEMCLREVSRSWTKSEEEIYLHSRPRCAQWEHTSLVGMDGSTVLPGGGLSHRTLQSDSRSLAKCSKPTF